MKHFNKTKNMDNKMMVKPNIKSRMLLSVLFATIILALSGCSTKSSNQSSSNTNVKTTTSIDVSEFIGQPISIAVEKFGEYSDVYDHIGQPICQFSDGLVMTNANNLISSVKVDYSEISSKTKYSYKGINGNSTKNDVIKILGEPKDLRFTTDSYSRYPIDNNEFKVTYSEDGLVIHFTFEIN